MQAKESRNSRAQDEVAEENKADQKALHNTYFFGFFRNLREFACSQCVPCRSNCTRGFLNDQPEILMQQSTLSSISLNLLTCFVWNRLTSRRSCCTRRCIFFLLLSRSPEILGLRSSLLTLYGAGLGFSWQALPCIFVAARLCDSFADVRLRLHLLQAGTLAIVVILFGVLSVTWSPFKTQVAAQQI